jgi:hypothetical protein
MLSCTAGSGVGTTEQIAYRLPAKQRPPSTPLVLRPVVDHVAALAEGGEVGVRVVRGVVIPMGCGQNDPGPASVAEDVYLCRDPDPAAPAVAPAARIRVPPAPITEVVDHSPVRPPAALTAASRPPEADHSRELRPVDGVEEAVLGPDRHGGALCHRAWEKRSGWIACWLALAHEPIGGSRAILLWTAPPVRVPSRHPFQRGNHVGPTTRLPEAARRGWYG